MPRLLYPVDCTAAPMALAAQALNVLRLQGFAQRNGLPLQESELLFRRVFALVIPPERMNDVLWDLNLEGLLTPTQEVVGHPLHHTQLEERFATLTWIDSGNCA